MTDTTTTKGNPPNFSATYSASTNRQTGDTADANGNITYVNSQTLSYDIENRIRTAQNGGGTVLAQYGYDPSNKRVKRLKPRSGMTGGGAPTGSLDEYTFWAPNGQKLGTYEITYDSNYLNYYLKLKQTWVYFGGKLVSKGALYTGSGSGSDKVALSSVVQDRLGSQNGKFYPYGIERPSASANDTEKFATYTRDSATGLDYALNRYHQPGYGRFLSPDPYPGSAHPGDPGSWNRYEYVEGDPTNRTDSSGLCSVIAAGITQSPSYSSTYCLQKLGLAVGGILVFDYAGGTVLSGVKDVAAQGLGNADAATIAVLNAIAVAAQTPGPIDIFAFSGGAQAFSTAMSYLNSATAARIRNVTYLSPGSAELVGPLASGTGQTTVYAGNSLIDLIIGNATPSGASFIPTGCAHDSNCLIEKVFFDLIPLGGGPCSVGAGAQSGAGEPPNIFEMLLLSQITSLVYWFPPVNPLIEKVTSTIKYQEGAEN